MSLGTFYNILGAVAEAECLACPAGRYCPAGTTDPYYPSNLCPRGNYCPASSETPTPCNAGLYTEETGSTGVEFCKVIETGLYLIFLVCIVTSQFILSSH